MMAIERRRRWWSAMLLAIALSAACGDGVRQRTYLVHHFMIECTGLSLRLCLLVKETGPSDFEYLYDTPRGFDYEWGYTYELIVEERSIDEPAADQSSISRTLREIVSKEAVPLGTTFQLFLTAGYERIVETSSGVFEFYGAREFTCPENLPCDELRALIDQGAGVSYDFEHPANPQDPLLLLGWN